jgi:hypothetical protein
MIYRKLRYWSSVLQEGMSYANYLQMNLEVSSLRIGTFGFAWGSGEGGFMGKLSFD